MKKCRLLIVMFLLLILCGCSSRTSGSAYDNNAVTAESSSKVSLHSDIWDNFSKTGDFNFTPREPDLYLLYRDGLSNKNEYARWYCAYRIIEFADNDERKNEITGLLSQLSQDSSDTVRRAAEFSLEIINRTFNGEYFYKSPDGNFTAFRRFNESRYDNGEVWLYDKNSSSIGQLCRLEGSIKKVVWSPDSRKVCVSYFGRTWADTAVIDVELKLNNTGNAVFFPEISKYIASNSKKLDYNIGKNQRPDFCVDLVEWSPDSSRLMLSYNFSDDDYTEQSGVAIYSTEKHVIDTLIKSPGTKSERPVVEKPSNFKWN